MKNVFLYLFALSLLLPAIIDAQSIKAYYTNLGDDYDALEMDQSKLFGRYADIVVEIKNKGNVVFSRRTSYLPAWEVDGKSWKFEELVKRSGDGNEDRPDILSRYSYVRLISSNDRKAVVHWRYFPDFNNVEWDGVVDEYFTITADGKVTRERKIGTKRIDDWNNNSTLIKKSYQLSNSGIMEFIRSSPPYTGLPVVPRPDVEKADKPADDVLLSVSFDQKDLLKTNHILEGVSSERYEVAGHKTLIKKGVSGSALEFDGYYSGISMPFNLPQDSDGFTVESWVALGAYPFGPAPVIHQSIWNKAGFYLGVDEDGKAAIHIAVNGQWMTAESDVKLELFKWYHLSGAINLSDKVFTLYINGTAVDSENFNSGNLTTADTDLVIGLNSQLMPDIDGRIRIGKWPSMFGIDGLIDEVKIYDHALDSDEILNSYRSQNLNQEQINNPDMQQRKMPVNPDNRTSGKFGAKYTKLDYYETWDNMWRVGDYPDVVVSFNEMPVNMVSWRGISSGIYFVTENGRWVGDQSNEDYRLIEQPGEAEGCLEHMSDKQCRHSHIRIIENTDARVILHWRYGLVDSRYYFAPRNDGWGGWTDEYWTIYPDGVAVRDVRRGIVYGDGWVETMFLSAPGTMPEDNTELQAFSIIDDDGERTDLSWADGMPEGVFDDVQLTMVNTKADYRMFNVYPAGSSVEVFGGRARRSKFHWWNHWPVSQITSDGRGARAADRMAHSSLVWGAPAKHMLMYGITNKPLESLKVLASSWNYPPVVKISEGGSIKYNQGQRAYIIETHDKSVDLDISASEKSPLYNPCFVIKKSYAGKKARVKINGKVIGDGKDFRQGETCDTDGDLCKIIWLEFQSTDDTEIEITF